MQIWGKYRYFQQVSLVFDTEPALFMVGMYVQKPQENVNKSEEKAENVNFFLEVFLMELDQSKIINCVLDRILHSCPKPFWQQYCVNKTVPDGLNLLVSVSKFGIDTTKNPWYRIGIVSILKSWYRPYLIFLSNLIPSENTICNFGSNWFSQFLVFKVE